MPVDPDRLRPVELFDAISDEDLALVAHQMEDRVVEAGEHLARRSVSGGGSSGR